MPAVRTFSNGRTPSQPSARNISCDSHTNPVGSRCPAILRINPSPAHPNSDNPSPDPAFSHVDTSTNPVYTLSYPHKSEGMQPGKALPKASYASSTASSFQGLTYTPLHQAEKEHKEMRILTYDQPGRAASPGRQSHLSPTCQIVVSSSSSCLCTTSSCCCSCCCS